MNIKHTLTDKVRATLLRKGVISWGKGMRDEVNDSSRMLQQISSSGRLVFKKRPDGLFSLLHVTVGYGSKPVILGNHTDTLLGARIRNGVPCYESAEDVARIRARLVKLGVDVPIISM